MSPIDRAKHEVFLYVKDRLDPTDGVNFAENDVYIVWFAYILGGWKALVSTSLPDGMYYEVTSDVVHNKIYVDAYKRFDQKVVVIV